MLREVIDAAPSFAKPAEDLGYLLRAALAARRTPCPSSSAQRRLDPSLERAWFNLGKALAMLGRGKEADAAFEKCFELSPERRHMALAAEHQKEGRLEEAERMYRRVLRDNPRNVDALRLLALIAIEADHAGRCRAAAAGAIEIAPDFLLAILDLGPAAQGPGPLRRGDRRASTARSRSSRTQPQAHFLRAATLARASFTPEAIAAYRHCLELQARARRRAARPRPRAEGRRRLRRCGRLVQRLHAPGAGLRRDLLEPRKSQDLPLRRRDGRRDGKAHRLPRR